MFNLKILFSFRTVWGLKILGFPVRIDNKKYARNAFYFNLCFVFDSWARTVQYEPLVKKLSEYLVKLKYFNFNITMLKIITITSSLLELKRK